MVRGNSGADLGKEFSFTKKSKCIPSAVGLWLGEEEKRTRKSSQPLDGAQFFVQLSLNCWYQCTIKGGREGRDVDAMELAKACEELGAGEILLNCIDKDGTNSGFDLELINQVRKNVSIPVIASSGAGKVEHFSEVFEETGAEAALAAGIFHREEVPISAVKAHLRARGIETR